MVKGRERRREQWRINQYLQLHSAFLKSYFGIGHHLRGEERSRKRQRHGVVVARRAGAVGLAPRQIWTVGTCDVTQGQVYYV